MRVRTSHALAIAAALIMAAVPGLVEAGSIHGLCNFDQECPVNGANEYTVTCTAPSPFDVTQIFVGPPDESSIPSSHKKAFPPGTSTKGLVLSVSSNGTISDPTTGKIVTNITISGNDSTHVTLTYTGTTFNQNDWTHVGLGGIGNGVTISNSYWSENGSQVKSSAGHQPGIGFNGTSSTFILVRITDYDTNNNVIGHEWAEQQSASFRLMGTTVPLHVSMAEMTSPMEIALDNLNANLTGFGPESTIMTLAAVPEPSSLILTVVGLLGMLGYTQIRRLGR
jgi:hypothetical protein